MSAAAAVAAIATSPNTPSHNPMQVNNDVIPGVSLNQALVSDLQGQIVDVEKAVAVAQAQQDIQQVSPSFK